MQNQLNESANLASRTKTNTIRLGLWNAAWVLSMVLAAFGPKLIWDFNTPLSVLGVLLNLGVGFKMISCNKAYLKGLDELQQKIQFEAMALSLGVGLVVGLSYELLEDIKLITFEPEIPHLIILMAITFMIGLIMGGKRYQ